MSGTESPGDARRKTHLGRARAGAKLLDQKLGRGWRRKIRRRDLDMVEPYYFGPGTCGCVLSQLDYKPNQDGGSYRRMMNALGIGHEMADDLGFAGDVDADVWIEVLREGDRRV